MSTTRTPGAPSWVDLSTPKVDEAVAFYTELLGWEVAVSDTPWATSTTSTPPATAPSGRVARSCSRRRTSPTARWPW